MLQAHYPFGLLQDAEEKLATERKLRADAESQVVKLQAESNQLVGKLTQNNDRNLQALQTEQQKLIDSKEELSSLTAKAEALRQETGAVSAATSFGLYGACKLSMKALALGGILKFQDLSLPFLHHCIYNSAGAMAVSWQAISEHNAGALSFHR